MGIVLAPTIEVIVDQNARSFAATVSEQHIDATISPKSYPVTVSIRDAKVVALVQQGPMGPAGDGITLIINIIDASTTWTLSHQLNRYPDPTFVDSSGDVVCPTWRYQDSNIIVANFGNPTSGVAYIN